MCRVVARGPHLAAMRANGLTLKQGGETTHGSSAHRRDPQELGRAGLCHPDAQGPRRARQRSTSSSRCSARTPPSSPARMACPGGISTTMAALMKARRIEASIPAGNLGAVRPGARPRRAWSGRPPKSRRRASSPIDGDALPARRAIGRKDASACRPLAQVLIARRASSAGARQLPRRDLAEALGQPVLQSDLGADRQHARGIVADAGTRAVARAMMVEAQAIGEALGVTSRSTSTAASTAPATSARTRPRCCRTSSAAARWRSTRW